MRWSTAISMFLAVSLGAVVVRAATPSEDPEALIRIGNELRRKGDEERALGYFKRAYEIAHTPRSAAQFGLAELAVDRFASAETHLSEALRSDDPWVVEHAKALQASRVTVRQHLLGVELVGAPRDATIVFADGTIVPIPADDTLWLTPGPASLKVQAIGHKDAAVEVTGAAGDHRKIQVSMPLVMPALVEKAAPPSPGTPAPAPVTLEPAATPPGPPGTDSGATSSTPMKGLKVAGIVVASVGVVAGVVGGVAFAAGSARESRFNDPSQPYSDDDANWKSLKYPGLGLIVGGGVAVATGVALFIVGSRSPRPEEQALSIDVGPGSGLLRWRGTF
jgi:hypothetical protein